MDDLSGAIGLVALIGFAILALACFGLVWWRRRFQPSPAANCAAWTGFIWGYGNLLRLAIIPMREVPQAIFTALVWGAAIVAAVWFIGRLVQRRRAE